MIRVLIIFILIFTKGISQETINIPVEKLNIKYNDDEKIYIHKINYFEYNKKTHLIDSVKVKNGVIALNKRNNKQFLFMFSRKKEAPITYLPLLNLREHYTSMFCSNFYTFDNYLLIENRFSQNENEFLNKFYKMFTKKSFDEKLYKNGKPNNISIENATKEIDKRKKVFLKYLEKHEQKLDKKFIDYIKTEIELGANNQLLNWYEEVYSDKIKNAFKNNNISQLHQKLYDNFLNKKWNKQSIQYFRTIERIINYNESQKRKEFNTYFKDINNRIELQKEIIQKTSNSTE